MSEFAGQRGRQDGQDRTPGMSHAVAAHPGKGQPGQCPAGARTHDQHIIRAARQGHQYPARWAPRYPRLHQRIVGNLTPHCGQRVPELLAREVLACLAQWGRKHQPFVAITTGRFPGNNRDQDGIVGAGQNLGVAQCAQAARGATRPHDQPAYPRHRSAHP